MGFVRLLDGPAVEGDGGITVAAHVRPASAKQAKHGGKRRHLLQDLFQVAARHPQHQARLVPLRPRPVRVVVAHIVHHARRSEQDRIPLEDVPHVQLVQDGPYVADSLDAPVEPLQVRRSKEPNKPCKLGKVSRSDAQVHGGIHAVIGVGHVLPDLAVEHLKERHDGDRKVLSSHLVEIARHLHDVVVHVERRCHLVPDEIRRHSAEPVLPARQQGRRHPRYLKIAFFYIYKRYKVVLAMARTCGGGGRGTRRGRRLRAPGTGGGRRGLSAAPQSGGLPKEERMPQECRGHAMPAP